GGGELLRDEPRLAHAGDHHAAGAGQHHLHRPRESAVEPAGELRYRLSLGADDLASVLDDVLLGCRFRHAGQSPAGCHRVCARLTTTSGASRHPAATPEKTALDAARPEAY